MRTLTDDKVCGTLCKGDQLLVVSDGVQHQCIIFFQSHTVQQLCCFFGDISIFSFLCAPLAGLKWAGLGWKNLMWPTSGNQSGFSKNLSKIWCWLVIKSDQTTATHSWWSSFSVKLSSNNTSTCFCYFKNWVGDSGKRQLIVESCSQIIKYQWAENDTIIN